MIALRAFNVELTQIPDNVKQEQLMQIRMQWWRDAVKSAYTDKPQPNPVIQALHAVQHSSSMIAEWHCQCPTVFIAVRTGRITHLQQNLKISFRPCMLMYDFHHNMVLAQCSN